MLAHMKRQIIGESTELILTISNENAMAVEDAITKLLSEAGYKVCPFDENRDEVFSFAEVFPDTKPGDCLKGLRLREDLTQKQFAEKLDIHQHHISEMEKGVRLISVDMAKRIGNEFDISYKVFL